MNDVSNLTDHFLIAMPTLEDPNFFHSVTYICEHNENGAMGIVINRPLDLSFQEVVEHMEIESSIDTLDRIPVYLGGPVQPDRGFVLHEPIGDWESTLRVNERYALTSSRDIVAAIANGEGPARYLVALGYAGWEPDQLEGEMAQNAWLSVPADLDMIMNTPAEGRWLAAARLLGVDLKSISHQVGHA